MATLMHTEEEAEATIAQINESTSIIQISKEHLQTRDSHWAERDAALQHLLSLSFEVAPLARLPTARPSLPTIVALLHCSNQIFSNNFMMGAISSTEEHKPDCK